MDLPDELRTLLNDEGFASLFPPGAYRPGDGSIKIAADIVR